MLGEGKERRQILTPRILTVQLQGGRWQFVLGKDAEVFQGMGKNRSLGEVKLTLRYLSYIQGKMSNVSSLSLSPPLTIYLCELKFMDGF